MLQHKRQRIWQIIVPFCLLLMIILAAAVFLLLGAKANTRLWADISLIWLLIPLLLFAVLALVILILLIFAFSRLTRAIPRYSFKAQQISVLVSAGTRRVADLVAVPVVWANQAGAALCSLFKR